MQALCVLNSTRDASEALGCKINLSSPNVKVIYHKYHRTRRIETVDTFKLHGTFLTVYCTFRFPVYFYYQELLLTR